jgi:5-oxoprolinase (ATP-hydrolysing)
VAEGFVNIAVQQMANAIKKISVARGYDVTRYTLQCFGGAGGQHACLVADALGMTRVLVHPLAGVLSAYGMGLADQNVIKEQAVERVLEAAALPTVAQALSALADAAVAELQRQQLSTGTVAVKRRVHVRYEGSDSALVVPWPDAAEDDAATLAAVAKAFEAAYQQRFAFLMAGKRLVVEAVSVEAVVAGDAPAEPRLALHPERVRCPAGTRCACTRAAPGTTPRWWCAKTCAPATWWQARPSLPRKTPPRWWSRVGPRT